MCQHRSNVYRTRALVSCTAGTVGPSRAPSAGSPPGALQLRWPPRASVPQPLCARRPQLPLPWMLPTARLLVAHSSRSPSPWQPSLPAFCPYTGCTPNACLCRVVRARQYCRHQRLELLECSRVHGCRLSQYSRRARHGHVVLEAPLRRSCAAIHASFGEVTPVGNHALIHKRLGDAHEDTLDAPQGRVLLSATLSGRVPAAGHGPPSAIAQQRACGAGEAAHHAQHSPFGDSCSARAADRRIGWPSAERSRRAWPRRLGVCSSAPLSPNTSSASEASARSWQD